MVVEIIQRTFGSELAATVVEEETLSLTSSPCTFMPSEGR